MRHYTRTTPHTFLVAQGSPTAHRPGPRGAVGRPGRGSGAASPPTGAAGVGRPWSGGEGPEPSRLGYYYYQKTCDRLVNLWYGKRFIKLVGQGQNSSLSLLQFSNLKILIITG